MVSGAAMKGVVCGEGQSRWLVPIHSSGSRPAFVSMAGASNPAVRIGPDKMFGQACA